jgi:hypothetical protein
MIYLDVLVGIRAIADAQVRSQACPFWICGEQVQIGIVSCGVFRFCPVNTILTSLRTQSHN